MFTVDVKAVTLGQRKGCMLPRVLMCLYLVLYFGTFYFKSFTYFYTVNLLIYDKGTLLPYFSCVSWDRFYLGRPSWIPPADLGLHWL